MTRSSSNYPSEAVDDSIEDYAEQIRRIAVERSASEIQEVARLLDQAVVDTEVKIPERNFVAVFLPFFAGTGNPYNVDITRWVSIVGSPFKSAKLIDDRGDIVYEVPPLVTDSALRLIDEHGPNMRNMLTTAQLYQTVTPQHSENYIREGLKTVEVIDTEMLREVNPVALEWIALFKHYGAEPEWMKNAQTANEPPVSKLNDKVDDFIWED